MVFWRWMEYTWQQLKQNLISFRSDPIQELILSWVIIVGCWRLARYVDKIQVGRNVPPPKWYASMWMNQRIGLWQSQRILTLERDIFFKLKSILICVLGEPHSKRRWGTCKHMTNVLRIGSTMIQHVIVQRCKNTPSTMSFVLWRRKVPERIVTNPHISVTIWVGFCLSQSCIEITSYSFNSKSIHETLNELVNLD